MQGAMSAITHIGSNPAVLEKWEKWEKWENLEYSVSMPANPLI